MKGFDYIMVRRLNEASRGSGSQMKYLADRCYFDRVVDSYTDGELSAAGDWVVDLNGQYDSIQGIIDDVASHVDVSKNISDWAYDEEQGAIMTDALVNEDDMEPSQDELNRWRSGKYELYTIHAFIRLQVSYETRNMTYEEAEQLGLQAM